MTIIGTLQTPSILFSTKRCQ